MVFDVTVTFNLFRGGQFYWWGNRSTRRDQPTCRKSLTNFITLLYQVHLA